GFSASVRPRINEAVRRSYRESMQSFAAMHNLDLWYARIDIENDLRSFSSHASARQRKRFERNVARASTKDSLKAFGKLTRLVDGEPEIVSDPPLIVSLRELMHEGDTSDPVEGFARLIRSYRRTLPADRRRLLER